MEGTYKKIEIAGMIKYKISISTKIQEALPENLKISVLSPILIDSS
jgi:hypothetical protein